MWLLCDVYNTQERLFKMKKVKSPKCVLCSDIDDSADDHCPVEDRKHFVLQCAALKKRFETTTSPSSSVSVPVIINYIDTTDNFLRIILDPFSSQNPFDILDQ